jgi:hypothetical protein
MLKKLAIVRCKPEFIEMCTYSYAGLAHADPSGYDFYFSLKTPLEDFGNAMISALSKSRDFSSTPEEIEYVNKNCPQDILSIWDGHSIDELEKLKQEMHEWHEKYYQKWVAAKPERALFKKELTEQRNSEWLESVLKKYQYKNKTALFKNMQVCSVTEESEEIKFLSHGKDESSNGTSSFKIKSTSPSEVIGAAVKYSIARCTGKGADVVAKKLFPGGVPESFEDYLKSLNLQQT